jgi:hypothetical protein
LSTVTTLYFNIIQLDVKTAFLYGRALYLEQLEGFVLTAREGEFCNYCTIIAIWVDDGMVCNKSNDVIYDIINYLKNSFVG